ncbi:MAG TPA: N-acetyl-gamma-glutamyl-phosphate reductase [Pirellulaceae bacterium]|nr:N-acetyl-gamma-glutamyl-phosphate reductase [Pirellulaceae bacterium]HMO92473.1 N-acetyl-gamma-glutamyl-phosphate reductase [Pirellulaceae bacterium]HMP67857.1 N-acetyl-gamma-glutamyl-phosphate reductase [Pirellulaceae bacterium]
MINVGLVGGRGYVGEELLVILDRHPQFDVTFVGSSSLAGQSVNQNLDKSIQSDLIFESLDPTSMRKRGVDVWILAQSNGQAANWVTQLAEKNTRFLDISYDFRFNLAWVYGLPERFRHQILHASRVSNPGCYATAVQLALLPLRSYLDAPAIAFGISGYSGAGKTPSERNNTELLANNIIPYSLIGHGHEREISHHLGHPIHFMPHVAPFFRGISVTISATLLDSFKFSDMQIEDLYRDFYRDAEFVDIQSEVPQIRAVACTNRAIIGGFQFDPAQKRLITVCVLDNLLKGAASQAVQNLNLMFGLPESLGLV